MRALAALLVASVLLSNTPAFAQADPYKTGVKLENSGDLVSALASFESIPAEKRDFNARLHIAGCKKKLGRLLEAERDYESIRTDAKADPATVETAASDLEDLRPRIPKLVVKLSPATTNVKITIDGHEAKVPATLTVNPGTHSIIATRGDAQVFKRDVTMSESMAIEVEIDAPATGSTVAVAGPSKSDPVPAPAPATSSGNTQRTWGWIAIGSGVAFGAAAAGAWIHSAKLYDEVNNCRGDCDDGPLRRWETLATVGVGIAVVSAGIGVTLLITAPKDRAVAVQASPRGVFLVGSF